MSVFQVERSLEEANKSTYKLVISVSNQLITHQGKLN